ncbi:MAG: SprB repeat-containing protein [Bacteroidetes bacterium]|nr:SprB repeat-containing protein [Bacteroidota bacterium]
MKKQTTNHVSIFIVLSFLLLSKISFATDLDVVITITKYPSGTDVSCHGVQDGTMEAVIVGGVPPYSFQWTNGAFTAYTKKDHKPWPG